MKDPTSRGGLRSVLVACLCGLFFLLAMGITLLSSGVYRETVDDSDHNATQRMALSYLVNQVRRGDVADGVSVGTFQGSDALVVRDGAYYFTVLYYYDGALRELYTEEGTGLTAEAGTAMVPLSALSIQAEGDQLILTATGEDGQECAVTLSPRCGLRAIGEVTV